MKLPFVMSARRSTLFTVLSSVFAMALLLSALLHIILVSVGFSLPTIKAQNFIPPQLELVLVNSKTNSKPEQADALAQSNLDGGGNTDDNRQAKSPLPSMSRDQRQAEIRAAEQQVSQLEAENRRLMTQLKAVAQVNDVQASSSVKNNQPPSESAEGVTVARSLEMAQLEAQISQQYEAYQKRPRKLFVGARTQEYAFARYIEDWRIKVERVGNENYPAAARQKKIYGTLQLTVSIKADGTLDDIEVTRSSNSTVLDNAAVAIVRMAAPYAAFPDDMRKKADVISITRTWIFAPSDELSTHE